MARKRKSQGSVYPFRGRWVAQLPDQGNGKRPSKSFDTEAEGWTWIDEHLAKATLGMLVEGGRGRVQDHMEVYFTGAARTRKGTTMANKGERFRRFIKDKPFGLMEIGAVLPGHIDAVMGTTPPNWTRVHVGAMLSTFFEWATANRLTIGNPYVLSRADEFTVHVHRTADRRANIQNTWTVDEVWRFIDTERDELYRDVWLAYLAFACRRGELIGLQWANVFVDLGYLTLAKNVTVDTEANIIVEELPKNWQKRPCYFGSFAAKMLASRQVEQAAFRDRHSKWNEEGWVFDRRLWRPVSAMRPGEHLHPRVVTRRFNERTKRLGLLSLGGPHGLRRSFGKLAEKAGFSENVRETALGHSETLARRYARPSEAELRELALWMDDQLAKQFE